VSPANEHEERQSRARGSLLGLLVGDALGSQVEFESAASIKRQFPDGVREMREGGPFKLLEGQVTDDGELALALARSLVAYGAFVESDVALRYVAWRNSGPFDCGLTIGRALKAGATAAALGTDVSMACRMAANLESQANGALMRIAPLGILGWASPAQGLAVQAYLDAGLTHPHPACLAANAAFVVGVAAAVRTGDSLFAYRAACEAADAAGVESVVQALSDAAHRAPEGFDGPHSGWVLIALQNAFHHLCRRTPFDVALTETIGNGGDTDTTAAITGALLGAAYGVDPIPIPWLAAVLSCRPDDTVPDCRNPRPPEYWAFDALELADALVAAGAS
jgi:ADP-ribosyl-[dinitrogen reductase] hydrolase